MNIVCVGSPYHYIAFKFSVGFFSWLQKILVYNFTYVSIYSNFWTISERLGWVESGVSVLHFHAFFFFCPCAWTVKSLCRGQKTPFIDCSYTVHALFMGSTTLFTHLKIILLQCFQFSVSATISSIQTDHKYDIVNINVMRQLNQ